MKTYNIVPPVGSEITFNPQIDTCPINGTWMARISFDREHERWQISSRYDEFSRRWLPVKDSNGLGMFVLLTGAPDIIIDNTLRVKSVAPSGSFVHAESVALAVM